MRFRHGAAMARALVQAGKAAGAGAAAMMISDLLFGLPDAYVAAWSAILTVHVTVYRSARISVQQTAATAIGVVVAWSAVHAFGAGLVSLTAAIFVALWIGSWHRFSQDQATAGSAVLFIFALGYASDEHMLLLRLGDVLIGAATGVVVNLAIVPPMWTRSVRSSTHALGRNVAEVLRSIAEGVEHDRISEQAESWLEAASRLRHRADRAWSELALARESSWWNPRRFRRPSARDHRLLRVELDELDHAIDEIRRIVRALAEITTEAIEDPSFRTSMAATMNGLADIAEKAAKGPETPPGEPAQRVSNGLAELRENAQPWPERETTSSIVLSLHRLAQDLTHPSHRTGASG
jgi:uncharacterized membrane protein YgaE (UPF0421/DUF939 family)